VSGVLISDYQFCADVDPQVPFGFGTPLNVTAFNPGTGAIRHQDQPGGMDDSIVFGRDLRTPPTWQWSMFTDLDTIDVAGALAQVDTLAQVWDNDVRLTPGGTVAMRYTVAGRTRKVYGRPRRWTPVPDQIQRGKIHITCDFQLAEYETYYDDEEESIPSIPIAPTVVTGTYFTFPLQFPLVMASSPTVYTEQAVLTGSQRTWVTPRFHGPVQNPWVQIGDQRYGLQGSIPSGQTVRISGRPWEIGIFNETTGVWGGLNLDPRSRLTQLRLLPGTYPITYGGYDPTGTSTCSVAWNRAYRAL
jgi:hypothetical protein